MSLTIILPVVRRTVTLPETLDQRVRAAASTGESFSAAVARLLQTGLGAAAPSYVGIADGGAGDDSRRVEELVGEVLDRAEREERSR